MHVSFKPLLAQRSDILASDNPLDPLNDIHNRLKKFLLGLLAFVRNPPYAMLEEVEKVVNLAFQNPKCLCHRDPVSLNHCFGLE